MAAVVFAQLEAQVVGSPYGDPTDVESDTTNAPYGTVNVFLTPQAGSTGFLTLEPIVWASVGAELVNGPCTLILSQGAGTVDVAVSW